MGWLGVVVSQACGDGGGGLGAEGNSESDVDSGVLMLEVAVSMEVVETEVVEMEVVEMEAVLVLAVGLRA
jgi:hypothetical protein